MIKKTYVRPVKLHLYCDQCGTEMVMGDRVYMTYPPQYPYECPNCGATKVMESKYPKITYEEAETE